MWYSGVAIVENDVFCHSETIVTSGVALRLLLGGKHVLGVLKFSGFYEVVVLI